MVNDPPRVLWPFVTQGQLPLLRANPNTASRNFMKVDLRSRTVYFVPGLFLISIDLQ